MTSKKWDTSDIPNLTDKTFVVTGATSGLGLASAIELAGHGARVVVTGRNPKRLRSAFEAVAAAATTAPPESVILDLASLASVREAAEAITRIAPRVDVLLNNAGVMATPEGKTTDGFEMQIGTNHLGHYALTGLLLPLIPHKADPDSGVEAGRVVSVSSLAHKKGKVVVDDLSFENRKYSPWDSYGQSKLANLLFISELARRSAAANWDLIAAAAHPGVSETNLFDSGPKIAKNPIVKASSKALGVLFLQSAEDGALPSLFAATAPGVESDGYYGPDGFMEMRGNPKPSDRTSASKDPDLAGQLWEKSAELTGVTFNFDN